MADDYVPFDEALKSLKMSEDELKRLVSQDQIQAIRDRDGRIQLRKEDLESFLASQASVSEELVFADDDAADDTGMVTAVLEEDSLLEEDDTLDLAPDELEVGRAAVVAAAPSRRGRPAPVRSKGRAAAIRGAEDSGEETTLDRVLTIATAVLLVYTLFFAWSIVRGQSTGLTGWLANMFKV